MRRVHHADIHNDLKIQQKQDNQKWVKAKYSWFSIDFMYGKTYKIIVENYK